MNEPIPYQSQIIRKDNEIVVLSASALQRFVHKYFILMYLPLIVVFVIGLETNFLLGVFGAVSVFILLFLHHQLPTNITINEKLISNNHKSVLLAQIPYIDIQVKNLENQVEVKVGEIKFRLKNAEDFPVLIDAIAEKGNVEFYDNYQLSNNRQVVTYKSKRIAKPVFATFLIIKNTAKSLSISDMMNQESWFEVHKNKATQIKFSSLSDANLTTQMLDINAIKILYIRIKRNRLELIANNSIFIYQSIIRNTNSELTNLRDGENMYELLKNLSALKNVKIEKVLIK